MGCQSLQETQKLQRQAICACGAAAGGVIHEEEKQDMGQCSKIGCRSIPRPETRNKVGY